MNHFTALTDEAEARRQEILADLSAQQANWSEQSQPGSFACHELLDRTAMLAKLVDEYLVEHPACAQNKDWFALAHQASTLLNELYQKIGAEHV
jgi:hypothetical protein